MSESKTRTLSSVGVRCVLVSVITLQWGEFCGTVTSVLLH